MVVPHLQDLRLQEVRLTRKRELTVSMGPYETYKFGAEVSATHHDIGYSDETLLSQVEANRRDLPNALDPHDQLHKFVDEQLDKALVQEVEDAADLTADKKSFLLRALK